ncbi:SIS domain-containing protein [Microbulbifer halophilus]|uniref:SIS domain-containing protein n=1 Tax=Microbulbifer halophilus TaxID=453963 RepID=A0ABW5E988_9GAMM|nr:SIS domain-containing protein [Microbulbifer halophilus]MCW8124974.1 SIS domain-containing protein [Microbulbifer halophilus]
MSSTLAIDPEQLRERNGYWTAREIAQQPQTWRRVADLVDNQRADLEAWLAPLLAQPRLRIVLTGAGTSAYVGETLAPYLSRKLARPVEAISTTDLMGNPDQYLLPDYPTLLVSYARSGNSPESVGAYQLADQLVDNCYHMVVSCNPDGELAERAAGRDNSYSLLMPEETLDRSFAMTSSFTAMMLATLTLFSPDTRQLEKTIAAGSDLLETQQQTLRERAQLDFHRIAFLGSGGLKGIATESALKMLELTAGQIDCHAESPLGFRHGPKSMVDERTLVMLFASGDDYTGRYDDDLYRELQRDGTSPWIFSATDLFDTAGLDDAWLSFPYILCAQLLAFYKCLALDITPDNPCPSGEVNRVVQGVTIHPFTPEAAQ